MSDSSIEKLTSEMSAGRHDAVELFYRQYFESLYAHARRITGRDESFCLDVVQEAVLRIIRNVRAVKCEKQFEAWLRLVVQTTALDQFRSEKRRGQREMVPVELHSCDDFPYGLFDDEHLEWLDRQLKAFDPQLVEMIELRFEEKWTLARIGEKLGLSAGAIDGRLRRALKELHDRAAKEFGND